MFFSKGRIRQVESLILEIVAGQETVFVEKQGIFSIGVHLLQDLNRFFVFATDHCFHFLGIELIFFIQHFNERLSFQLFIWFGLGRIVNTNLMFLFFPKRLFQSIQWWKIQFNCKFPRVFLYLNLFYGNCDLVVNVLSESHLEDLLVYVLLCLAVYLGAELDLEAIVVTRRWRRFENRPFVLNYPL